MGAIVTVTTTTDQAWKALIDVVQDPKIDGTELGPGSGIYGVVFKSAAVAVGSGYDTLRLLMEERSPGAGAGLERVEFG